MRTASAMPPAEGGGRWPFPASRMTEAVRTGYAQLSGLPGL